MILVNSKNSFPQMVVFLLCSSMFPHFSKYCFVWFLLIFFFILLWIILSIIRCFSRNFWSWWLWNLRGSTWYLVLSYFGLGIFPSLVYRFYVKNYVEIHWLMMQVKIIKIEGWRSCYVIGTNKGLEDFSYLLYSLFLFLLIFGWHHQLINMCSK